MSRFFSPKYLRYRDAGKAAIDHDRPCTGCGYNVRGLRFGGTCPECGAPIILEDLAHDALSDAPRPQIVRLRNACWLATVAAFGLCAVPALAVASYFVANLPMPILLVAIIAAWVVAVFWLTVPIQAPGAERRQFGVTSPLRRVARWTQLGWLVAIAILLSIQYMPTVRFGLQASLFLAGVAALIGLVGIIAVCFLLIELAVWCYNDSAVKQLTWAGWGLGICSLCLLLSPVWVVAQFLACVVVVFWLAAWLCFLIGLTSLGKSVSWSAFHAWEREERAREARAIRSAAANPPAV